VHETSVLIVDDELSVRIAVDQVLQQAGFRVRCAAGGAEAIALLAKDGRVDVILLDRAMPDGPGERFVPRIRELSKARILFFSGQSIEPSIAALADGVISKPADGETLIAAVAGASRLLRYGAD
jgi:two-component system cell cycle sensor histidine kinase/response regulator CckA